MSQYIETIVRSRSAAGKNSLASVEIDLSTLTGRDWIEAMDDASANWQQGFLIKAMTNLFQEGIWEIDGQFYGIEYLLDVSGQSNSRQYIDIFDRYVRTFPNQQNSSLDHLVQLTGAAILDRKLVA